MALQYTEYFIGEPRRVPKFKCGLNGSRKRGKKFLQQFNVRLQVWRELKQNWPQLPCLSQQFDGAKEAGYKIDGPFETLDVGDDLMRLHAKAKVGWCLVNPFLGSSFLD